MKRTSFETRERAAELMREAVEIWKQSPRSEMLEGLENDPVFNMLIMALARQANELDAEISCLRDSLWDDFASEMIPYAIGGPTPARVLVSMMPAGSVSEVPVDDSVKFSLKGGDGFEFMPLFRSRAIAADISSVVRLDGRRWAVRLSMTSEVHDLGGFCFSISGCSYRDLLLTSGGREIRLIRPWDYADVPYTEPFSIDAMLHNHSRMYDAASECMDLFAVQSRPIYIVDGSFILDGESRERELVFEFTGIDENFTFDRSKISLNVNVLVNAGVESAVLTDEAPFVRIQEGKSLMHLLHPSDSQVFNDLHVRLIRTGGDRFNPTGLSELLDSVLSRFHTDYYAFGRSGSRNLDDIMAQLSKLTYRLRQEIRSSDATLSPGTYLCLMHDQAGMDKKVSVPVSYVTTSASAVNALLTSGSTFSCPAGLDESQTVVLGDPVLSEDSPGTVPTMSLLARYYMSTSDRIVTPADIRIFCRTRLMISFGIAEDMINSVKVRTCLNDSRPAGYCTRVDISLSDNRFISKSFIGRIPEVENMLSKMMMVRSAGICPIVVRIVVE